jgi:4-carboxymuconolactone decarboxylase
MPRVPLVPADTDDAVLRPIFDRVRAQGVDVPTLYLALGNAPDVLSAWTRMAWPLRTKPTSARWLRELVILRVAQLTGAAYEWQHHRAMALGAGVSTDQIDALHDWQAHSTFDDLTRACLVVTDELALGTSVSDGAITELAQLCPPSELVELIVTIAFYCCVSRVLNALGIEPEPDDR